MHWRRKWQPTPVFLPAESQGRGSLVGCHLWGHTESDTTEVTEQQQQQKTAYEISRCDWSSDVCSSDLWGSLGKNTGVGCHVLLQCMKVKSESEVVQLCLTLSESTDCSLPGSSIHGIFQARVLEWGAIAFSTGSSQPRDQT